MKTRICAAAAAMVMSMPLSPAYAACDPSDLEGRWDAYTMGEDAGLAYWNRCTVRFDDRARFRSGSKCSATPGDKSTLSSSTLRLARNCTLKGSFRQNFEEGSVKCDLRATLAESKEVLSGVGECDGEAIFLLNMVRR